MTRANQFVAHLQKVLEEVLVVRDMTCFSVVLEKVLVVRDATCCYLSGQIMGWTLGVVPRREPGYVWCVIVTVQLLTTYYLLWGLILWTLLCGIGYCMLLPLLCWLQVDGKVFWYPSSHTCLGSSAEALVLCDNCCDLLLYWSLQISVCALLQVKDTQTGKMAPRWWLPEKPQGGHNPTAGSFHISLISPQSNTLQLWCHISCSNDLRNEEIMQLNNVQ